MVQDGSLRTAKQFDHTLRDEYTLQIRVFDNGTPPLYSDTFGKYIFLFDNIFSFLLGKQYLLRLTTFHLSDGENHRREPISTRHPAIGGGSLLLPG